MCRSVSLCLLCNHATACDMSLLSWYCLWHVIAIMVLLVTCHCYYGTACDMSLLLWYCLWHVIATACDMSLLLWYCLSHVIAIMVLLVTCHCYCLWHVIAMKIEFRIFDLSVSTHHSEIVLYFSLTPVCQIERKTMIPHLRKRLLKIITHFKSEVRLNTVCNSSLEHDTLSSLRHLNQGRKRAVKVSHWDTELSWVELSWVELSWVELSWVELHQLFVLCVVWPLFALVFINWLRPTQTGQTQGGKGKRDWVLCKHGMLLYMFYDIAAGGTNCTMCGVL